MHVVTNPSPHRAETFSAPLCLKPGVVFKLTPIFLLWLVRRYLCWAPASLTPSHSSVSFLPGSHTHEYDRLLSTNSRQVPDENPKDVVARIDAELADADDDTVDDSSDQPVMNGSGKEAGSSAVWDFSGWPMLLLLMPPVGFVTVAQPIMNMYVTTSERTLPELVQIILMRVSGCNAWLLRRIYLSSIVLCQVCAARNVLVATGAAAHWHSSLPNLRERRHPKRKQRSGRGTRGRAHVRRWASLPVGQVRSE